MRVLRSLWWLFVALVLNLMYCNIRGYLYLYEDVATPITNTMISVTNWAVYAAFAWFVFEVGRLLSRLLGLTGVR